MSIHILDALYTHHAQTVAPRLLEREIADYRADAERLDSRRRSSGKATRRT